MDKQDSLNEEKGTAPELSATQSREGWLASLKSGDEVALYHTGGWRGWYEFRTVARLTAKFIVVGATRFRIQDGRKAGDLYGLRLEQPTDDLKAVISAEARRQTLTRELDHVRWDTLDTNTLEAVYGLLPKKPVAKSSVSEATT